MEGLRQSARGTTGKVIVGLVIVAFGFMGVSTVINLNHSQSNIEVNGEKLSSYEVSIALRRLLPLYRQYYGQQLSDQQIQQQILNQVVQQKLIEQQANSLDMVLSKNTIDDEIRNDSEFQVDGQYNKETANKSLAANGITAEQFRGDLERQLKRQQFVQGVFNNNFVTEQELERYFQLAQQERQVQVLEVKPDQFSEQVIVSSQEVLDFYSSNQSQFLTDESVEVDFLRFTKAQLVGEITVDESDMDVAYKEYVEQQQQETQKNVSHILIETKTKSDSQALAVIKEIEERLAEGEQFGQLAATYSDDFASKDIGGRVGAVSEGSAFDPLFIQAALALDKEKQISSAVKTNFGYHLIQLDEFKQPEIASFDQMQTTLEQQIKSKESNNLFTLKIEELNDSAFSADTLQQVADDFSAQIQQQTISANASEKMAAFSTFKSAVLSNELRTGDFNSEVIRLNDDEVAVARVTKYQAAQVKELALVEQEITQTLTAQKAKASAQVAAEKQAESLQGLAVAELVLDENFSAARSVKRDDSELGGVLSSALFAMPKSDTVVAKAVEFGNSYYIMVLTKVIDAQIDPESQGYQALSNSLPRMYSKFDSDNYVQFINTNAQLSGI